MFNLLKKKPINATNLPKYYEDKGMEFEGIKMKRKIEIVGIKKMKHEELV